MRLLILPLFAFLLICSSCGQDAAPNNSDTLQFADTAAVPMPPTNGVSFHPGMQVECKTFQITDSTSTATHGWGYELYVDGKKIIRQAIMPAVGGICAFMTEEDARKMGSLAAYRFGTTGNFPTIKLTDYDSLQIQMPAKLKASVDSTIAAQKKSPDGK